MTLHDVFAAAKQMLWYILGIVTGVMLFIVCYSAYVMYNDNFGVRDFFNDAYVPVFVKDYNSTCGKMCAPSNVSYVSLFRAGYYKYHDFLCSCDGLGGHNFTNLGVPDNVFDLPGVSENVSGGWR
jgi:hypothetical protein